MKFILRLLLLVCSVQSAYAQLESDENVFNVFVGTGVPYSGIVGMNVEVGFRNFSVFAAGGYSHERRFSFITVIPPDTITGENILDPTINYSAGVRYRFNYVQRLSMVPRIGTQLGWVTNYYNDQIEGDDYDYSVYGFSFHAGAEFDAPLLIDLDLVVSPAFAVLQLDRHPFYPSMYFGGAVGIGFDLRKLKGKGRFRSR